MKYFRILIIAMLTLGIAFAATDWIPLSATSKEKSPVITVLKSNNEGILLEIEIPGIYNSIEMRGGEEYNILSFLDYGTTQDVGFPQLPMINELVEVPSFAKYKISIIESESKVIKGMNIMPFQEPAFDSEVKDNILNKDVQFYLSNKIYPESNLKLSMPNIWRDIMVSNFSYCPMKYHPVKKEVEIYTKAIVKIEFIDGNKNHIKNKKTKEEWSKIYNNSVLNYQVPDNNVNSVKAVQTTNDYDMLIIAHSNYVSTIEKFAEWKRRRGYKVKVANLTNVGTSQTAIKNYISSEYSNYDISYVVFVGDVSQLTWYNPSTTTPGDFNYSLLTGGSTDYYPEVAIGRFAITSTSQLETMIEKTINYETEPVMNSWVRECLLIAHKEDAPYKYQLCSEQIRTATYSDSPTFTTAYGAEYIENGDECSNAQLTDHLDDGYGVVNYRGHGGTTLWGSEWNVYDQSYTTSNIDDLDNSSKQGILYSIACSNAAMDRNINRGVY